MGDAVIKEVSQLTLVLECQLHLTQDICISQLFVPVPGAYRSPNGLQEDLGAEQTGFKVEKSDFLPLLPVGLGELFQGLSRLSFLYMVLTTAMGLISTFRWVTNNFSTISSHLSQPNYLNFKLSPESLPFEYLLTFQQLFLIKYFIGMNKIFVYSSPAEA